MRILHFSPFIKTEEIILYVCKGAYICMTACINIFCVCVCVVMDSAVIIGFLARGTTGKVMTIFSFA